MNIALIFTITCLGVLSHSAYRLEQKYIYKTKIASPRQTLLAQNIGASICFLLTALGQGAVYGSAAWLPKNELLFWGAVAATTIASIYIQWANAESQTLADVSLTAPISALTPGLVTMTAFLLGENPSTIGWVGIVTVAIGTYWFGLGEHARSPKDLFRPFILLWLPSNFAELTLAEQQKARNKTRALRLTYGVATIGTIGLVADALVVRNGNFAIGYLLFSIVLGTLFLRLKKTSDVQLKLGNYIHLGTMASFWTVHILLVFSMYSFAQVAYVGTLKRFSIVFIAIGAYYLLGELDAKKRLLPIIVITIGAICLGLDSSMTNIIAKVIH
jgi:uncharacterized membrane protein